MNTPRFSPILSLALGATALLSVAGCDRKEQPAPASTEQAKAHAPSTEAHDHSSDSAGAHAHDGDTHAHGHGGSAIDLGTATIGAFEVRAGRDEGQIIPGKDAPIDATVTPAAGASVKVTAVRFWIGTQDAKGSVKARAEIEGPRDANHWHAHAEIPSPLSDGSKLWVEIEADGGEKFTGSFDLRR